MKRVFRMLKKFSWVILLVLSVIIVRWYYTRDGIKTLPVKKVSLENRIVKKTVSVSGEVKSSLEPSLSFNTTGKILGIYVKKGDMVKGGQLLAELDTTSFSHTVKYYSDSVTIAKRNKDLYVEQYWDHQKTAGGSDIYNKKLKAYDELIDQARASFDSQKASLRNYAIYAPFDGIVVDVPKVQGEIASVASPVVKIASISSLVFEIGIDQEDYGFVKAGQKVEMELDAYPNEIFTGELVSLPLYSNGSGTSTFIVEIPIKSNGKHNPLLGMTGDAKIVVEETTVEVPSLVYDEVYFDDNNKPYVWVIDNQYITKKYIEIGIEGDIYTEIKSTIDKPIITSINNDVEIKEGYKAQVVK